MTIKSQVTDFVAPTDGEHKFIISESLALRLLVPEVVCILK